MLEEVLKLQGKNGLIGGYATATMLTLLSIKDYMLRYDGVSNSNLKTYLQKQERIVAVIESMYLNIKYPYEGHIADGRYWDTLLAASALLSAGENP